MKSQKKAQKLPIKDIFDAELLSVSSKNVDKDLKYNTFDQFYRENAKKIFRFAWFRVGQVKEVAEDIMQDTFARAYAQWNNFQHRGFSYVTYLYTITHNLIVNWYRQASKNKIVGLEQAADIAEMKPNPLQVYAKKETQKLLVTVMKRSLNAMEQQVIWMKYVWDLPVKSIALRLKKTENAVKLILSRARRKILRQPEFKLKLSLLEI